MFHHIVFDIDGTLLDTERTGLLSLQKTVHDLLGVEMSMESLRPYFGIPSTQAVKLLQFPEQAYAAQVWEENFQALKHLITPFEGADEVLSAIKKAGRSLGLVTSRIRDEFHSDVTLHHWLPLLDCVVCAEDTEYHKPNPHPMLHYMQQTGAEAKDCLYIGDTIHDCHCAQRAGASFALALWGAHDAGSIPANYTLNTLWEILPLAGINT